MLDIARKLDTSGLRLQLILICGRNERLRETLAQLPHRIPMFVEGFTEEVPYYMRLSDFFIGKPGPGSISEALAMKLPVLVERNAWTLPQERYNAEWIIENQVGLVLRDFRHIVPAVAELMQPENYRRFREKAAARKNNAVFEIPGILERILKTCEIRS
jgi:1,2-diacylglycerol 3-beta-galactosyltransferase